MTTAETPLPPLPERIETALRIMHVIHSLDRPDTENGPAPDVVVERLDAFISLVGAIVRSEVARELLDAADAKVNAADLRRRAEALRGAPKHG